MQVIQSTSDEEINKLKVKMSDNAWKLLDEIIIKVNNYDLEKSLKKKEEIGDANIIFFPSDPVTYCMGLLNVEKNWILNELLNHEDFKTLEDIIIKEHKKVVINNDIPIGEDDEIVMPSEIGALMEFLEKRRKNNG